MEHPFKVGDEVFCVDPNLGIEKGGTYIVENLYWGTDYGPNIGSFKAPMVQVKGVSISGYFARRFELATPLKQEEQIPWWEGEKT